jgi:hypothetical protein
MIGFHTRRRGIAQAAAAIAYPLDALPAPLFALSVGRQLLGAFTGDYPLQVRRSADGTVQFVPFINGETDTANLNAFVGGGNGAIYSLRDQTGNGRHFLQTTNGNQPVVVESGALNTFNGKLAAKFSNNAWMRFSGSFSGLSALHHVAVVQITDVSPQFTFRRLVSWTQNAGSDFSDNGFMVADHRAFNALYGWHSNANSSKSNTGTGGKIITLRNSASLIVVGSDGVEGSSQTASYPGFNTWTEVTLGQTGMPTNPDNAFSGQLCEYVVWPQFLNSGELSDYLADAQSYWGL